MNKKEAQKRVLQNGKLLALSLFSWDEKTNTFSSNEDDLVIDFSSINNANITAMDNATITAMDNATITARYNSTITAMDNATITAGYNSTITAWYNATITAWNNSVVVNRNIFEVIILDKEKSIKICPYNVPGHLELIYDKWYLNGDKSLGEHIIADNILSKIIKKIGNVYKVINYNEKEQSYLVTDGENWSHGKTLKEAKDSLIYKISNRDKSKYKDMKLNTVYTFEEAIKMYRVITGACEAGVRGFLETVKAKKEKYSVKEIIEITAGQYGNQKLVNFVNEGTNEQSI